MNAFGGHLRFGMETGCGAGAAATDLLDATLFQDMEKPAAAATDLLDALGSTAIVLGDTGVLHSVCMGRFLQLLRRIRSTSRVWSLQRVS